MGKVRDYIKNDVEGLTEWIGRKIKNHDPMSVRDTKGRRAHFNPGGNKTKIVYKLADGRKFEISVRDVTYEPDPIEA